MRPMTSSSDAMKPLPIREMHQSKYDRGRAKEIDRDKSGISPDEPGCLHRQNGLRAAVKRAPVSIH
jgi:hypothetical protein